MENKTDYYRLASGFYQFEDLPDNYLNLGEDEFHKLLEANAWQPFEGYLGSDINELIDSLAIAFEKVERDSRKKTLDEVRGKLNIK